MTELLSLIRVSGVIRPEQPDVAELEQQRLDLERKKSRWNTPLVVALTGLISIGGKTLFDTYLIEATSESVIVEKAVDAKNSITLEQFKAEIAQSELRLSEQYRERQKKTEAELAALADERAFQFNLVKEQLASEEDQRERAKTLLFLAKSGILSTLNVSYLEDLANEQLTSKEAVIPTLALVRQRADSPDWSDLRLSKNARFDEAGNAVGLLRSTGARGLTKNCTAFFVREELLISANHCIDKTVCSGLMTPDTRIRDNNSVTCRGVYDNETHLQNIPTGIQGGGSCFG